MKLFSYVIIFSMLLFLSCQQDSSQSTSLSKKYVDREMGSKIFLHKDGKELFTIGFYELPDDNAKLLRYSQAGVNLFRCSGNADLDRVAAVDALGWVSIKLQKQDTIKVLEN